MYLLSHIHRLDRQTARLQPSCSLFVIAAVTLDSNPANDAS